MRNSIKRYLGQPGIRKSQHSHPEDIRAATSSPTRAGDQSCANQSRVRHRGVASVMEVGGVGRELKRFDVRGFLESVARGAEERVKILEAKRMDKEQVEEERRIEEEMMEVKRKERDRKTEMWTTQGLRPLAEPPILAWEQFERWYIPSDLRYNALFPHDPELRSKIKDQHGERGVLVEYTHCARMMKDDPKTDHQRREFYENLVGDLAEAYQEVDTETMETYNMATELSQFEFKYLDNDGRTTQLEQSIKKGAYIFHQKSDEIRDKYRDLIPPNFVENRVASFEFQWLATLDRSTGPIERSMRKGLDVLAGWPQEVQHKYEYLRRRYLPHLYQQAPSPDSESEEREVDRTSDTDLRATLLSSPTYSVLLSRAQTLPNDNLLSAQLSGIRHTESPHQHRASI